MSRAVKVTVAGQKLTIKTSAKPKYVKELASYVSAKVDEVRTSGRTRTTQHLALLAAMNIADELRQLQAEQAELKAEVADRTKRIIRFIDKEAEL